MKNLFPFFILFLLTACAASKSYNPYKKFSPQELQEDYQVFRNTLEESHPSLYWYTPKDSVDYYFDAGAAQLKDSMSESKFRTLLSYVIAQIKCGHTSVRASKAATAYSDRVRTISFPLSIKAWDDTVVITSNLSRKDSNVMRGALLTAVDGRPIRTVLDSLFKYLPADGYNTTHKYQTLSNAGTFRNLYGAVFGLKAKTPIEYIDTAGRLRSASLGLYIPVVDTNARRSAPPLPQPSKKDRKKLVLLSMRSLRIDTASSTATLYVNTFAKGYKLRSFFRSSFSEIRKKGIQHLVVDMRGNGGGSVVLSSLLTKYIADRPFKIADSLYAVSRSSRYSRYIDHYFFNRLFMLFMSHKKADGKYHFGLFEGKYFKPRSANHFNGDVYVMTGGNTFSAASLFTKALKGQENVTVVGEETGGGGYGNTAWLIPDVTLPHTKVRFRLPLFRLVIDSTAEKGRGILPDVESKPTVEAIRKNGDYKMDRVMELIRQKNKDHVQR